MSLNRLQNLGYTIKYQIDTGRALFLTYAQKKKMSEIGRLLGYNLFPPDNNASIVPQIEEGAVHTTVEDLERYLEELLVQLDLVPPPPKRPNKPEILFGEGGDNEAFVYFNAGKAVEDPVTNYAYSTDGGLTFRKLSPPDTISPLTITNTSESPFAPLVNGVPYRILISAINAIGTSDASNEITVTPVAEPDPPVLLRGDPGNRQASIFFTPGDDGGSPIINYKYSTDNGETYVDFNSPTTGTLAIGDSRTIIITRKSTDGLLLEEGETYFILLKAVTANGKISDPSNTIPIIPVSVPDAPVLVSATSENAKTTVSFTPGADDGGSEILNYEYSTDNGFSFKAFSPEKKISPVEITNISVPPFTPLENAVEYFIRLRAINEFGASFASEPISVIPSTLPDEPTDLSGVSLNRQAQIYFSEGFNGGSDITNYQYSTDNGATFIAFSPEQASSPVTISRESFDGTPLLNNGTSYTIRLKAVNVNGVSEDASEPETVIPSALPDPPTGVSAIHGDRQATILLTPGFDGGSPLTNYQYTTNGNDPTPTYVAFDPETIGTLTTPPIRSLIITNTSTGIKGQLQNSIPYYIRLKAVNVNGTSLLGSDPAVEVTPSTLPQPPTDLSGVSLDRQIQVSFIPGTNGGSVPINYEYSTDDGATFLPFSSEQATSPVTISYLSSDGETPLSNGTRYTIRLKAVNINGASLTASDPAINVIPSTIPDSPILSSSSSYGDDQQAIIIFTPQFDGGSTITNYQYTTNALSDEPTYVPFNPFQPGTVDPSDPSRKIVLITKLSTNTEISLQNGTPYYIKLKAVNVKGASDPASNEVSVTPATVPDAPSELSAE
jgi:large repetitive protein